MIKKKMFKYTFVEISFKISGFTESNKWNGILKIKYTNTIKTPYRIALEYPLVLSFFLVKKLTVKGIIGNTHGVSNASNPPIKPSPKILKRVLFGLETVVAFDDELLQLTFDFLISVGKNPYRIKKIIQIYY